MLCPRVVLSFSPLIVNRHLQLMTMMTYLFGDESEEEKRTAEESEAAKKDTKKPKESKPLFVLLQACVCLLLLLGSHVVSNNCCSKPGSSWLQYQEAREHQLYTKLEWQKLRSIISSTDQYTSFSKNCMINGCNISNIHLLKCLFLAYYVSNLSISSKHVSDAEFLLELSWPNLFSDFVYH